MPLSAAQRAAPSTGGSHAVRVLAGPDDEMTVSPQCASTPSVDTSRHHGRVPRRSAGLLVYRRRRRRERGEAPGDLSRELEVLLVHPGGPYWVRRDDGWWTIPKGEVDAGEDGLATAEREFAEELGMQAPKGPRIFLGEVVQAGGKHVQAWAVAGDVDVSAIEGGTFELEWPPRSGKLRAFPEVDLAAWYDLDAARTKILGGQLPLLDRLVAELVRDDPRTPDDAG